MAARVIDFAGTTEGNVLLLREDKRSRMASRADVLNGALPVPALDSVKGDIVPMRDLVFGGLTMYFFPGSPDPKSLNADDREHSAYRQLCPALRSHGLSVLGISSQPLREQEDALLRNEVQHPLVLDPDLEFADALGLPTFLSGGHRYSERLTLLVLSGRVAHVFHPIDRPDRNPEQVLTWMLAHAG